MDTLFINSENSKASNSYKLLLTLSDKVDLKSIGKYVALSNLSICDTWKNFKKSYKNNKFKISDSTRTEKLELPGGSYSVADIQDYFENNLKKTLNSD